MLCPRCQESLSAQSTVGQGRSFTLDRCERCDGVWVDGAEVTLALPKVAPLLRLPAMAPRRAPVGACPRCAGGMSRMVYLDVELDLCGACSGLWIDGDELEALARSDDRAAGHAPPAEGSRPAAARAGRDAVTQCTTCANEVALTRTMLTSHGPVCEPCFRRGEGGEEGDDAEVEAFQERLREGGGSHGDFGQAMLAVGSFLLAVLSATGRCPRCHCHHHSHCHH